MIDRIPLRRQTTSRIAWAVLLAATASSQGMGSEEFLQFRGPGGRGLTSATQLPDRWSATDYVAWKTEIPGRGWSSPLVVQGRVIITTAVNSTESEKPKKGLYFGGDRPEPPKSEHSWRVLALDLTTGKMLWDQELHHGIPSTPIHLKNSYASETPVSDGERLYIYFGGLGVTCLDLNGKTLWTKSLEPQPTRYGWGTASSPVLIEDRLYILNDNDRDSYLLALDKKTGKEIFKHSRDEKSNWSTPAIWEHGSQTEIVTAGTGGVRSYNLDGEELWSLRGMSSITIATPFEHQGLLFVSSGYVGDKSRPLYAVRPGAQGDISLAEGTTSNDWIAWSYPQAAPYNPTTIAYQDRLYVLHDRGLLSCYNAQTGAMVYDRERLPDGKAFTASPWAYAGHIYCLNEDGVTYVIQAGDQFNVVATNRLAEDDMCMATPAMVQGKLLVRTSSRLYCFAHGTSGDKTTSADEAQFPSFGKQVSPHGIRHAFLITGSTTALVDEQSRLVWQVDRASRDGFVLSNGNILVTYGDEVVEYQRDGTVVFRYPLPARNQELGTAVRLASGNTMVTELGNEPKLIEVTPEGKIVKEIVLQPDTDNAHMQTRMARPLANGNYLVPHLLAFAVKEYRPDGEVIRVMRTDLPELGGREAENWPFTAIQLPNGNTLVNLTHGNKTVELDREGKVVWKIDNEDVAGRFADPCGGQRLDNGNTVICSYGQRDPEKTRVFEVTHDKQVVWEYFHPSLGGVHEIHVLSTNGEPITEPLK